ncbi:MFS general substrate transporter [Dacryopinax primogenitus]|uniref:MFS general substrate transporter n=1 Tax=Dacryopinax primogenitus (strain DJM 731) TaxID=1858805 RepID=M5FRF4_DACPD|nr:MFS general substrate transporter [Dacryopinax primogenitus]EJT98243.1 MFS general substrate transporter [Dacryopinax primogenitus]
MASDPRLGTAHPVIVDVEAGLGGVLGRRTSMTLVPSPSSERTSVVSLAQIDGLEKEKEEKEGEEEIAYPGETEEAIERDEEEDFPDGGLKAWLVVAGGCSITVASFGYVNTWGIFQAYYTEHLLPNIPASQISWIGSIQYSFNFFPGLIMGRLFDLGYFRVPLFCASCFILLVTFLVAQCTEYWQFLLGQGFALGLASGFMSGPTVAVVGHWFKKRRAMAFGIVAAGSSIGGLVFPIVVSRLLPQLGFPWTMRILGLILMIFIIFANMTLRRRLPPVNVSGGMLNLKALRRAEYMLYTAATFVAFMGLFTALTYLNSDAVSIGISPTFATYLTGIANGASGFGRVLSGVFSDFVGPINILIPFNMLTAIATFAWPYATTEPSIIVVAVVYGFSSGAYSGLTAAPLANMGAVGDMGRRIGMTFTLAGFAALCGPPLSGAIHDRYGSYRPVGVYAGCSILISTGLLIFSKRAALGRFWGKF